VYVPLTNLLCSSVAAASLYRTLVISAAVSAMSSISATQSDGYYIHPDYINSGAYKKQSLNHFNKSKGHNQYLKNSVVRFELPYDGFCLNDTCKCHVGKGTRFNAHKNHVDDYHSTKIYEFRMKCRQCQHPFAIRTNPEQKCFDYVIGIKKKMEEFDTVEAKSLGVIDTDFGHAIYNFTDGMLQGTSGDSALDRLEIEVVGERKAISEHDAINMLMKHNHGILYDDATSNSNIRANYRIKRNEKKRKVSEAKSLGLGKDIVLDDAKDEDASISRLAFDRKDVKHEKSKSKEMAKFRSIRERITFGKNNGAIPVGTGTGMVTSKIKKDKAFNDKDRSDQGSLKTYPSQQHKMYEKKKKTISISMQSDGTWMPGTKNNKHQPSEGNGYEMLRRGENGQECVAKAALAIGSSLSALVEYGSDSS
jgi:coiled-coil domain-containing protein 130